ncbi:MAG: 50S ribosomal protein L30 [Nitrospinae bacterium]|nr:50S ribosomal protein L30 [Nitrospinota bacterium]
MAQDKQDKIRITLRKSTSGSNVKQRKVLHGLGLRRINQAVVKTDNACIRGMVFKIKHLVEVEEGA